MELDNNQEKPLGIEISCICKELEYLETVLIFANDNKICKMLLYL